MSNLIIQDTNEGYVCQTRLYKGTDSILAVVLFIVILLANFSMGKIIILNTSFFSTELSVFCITGIYSILLIGLVFLFCMSQKQNLSSIGLSKRKIGKSLVIGCICSILIIISRGVIFAVSVSTIRNNASLIIVRIIYFLVFIAFTEEILFRGYIGSRLLSHQKHLSVIITGIMCSVAHIPFQMAITQTSLMNYIEQNWIGLFSFVITHLIFQRIYSKYNNFAGSTLLHFVLNFSGWLVQLK